MDHSRRAFIKTTSAAATGVMVSPSLFRRGPGTEAKPFPLFCVFTKCLQFLDYERLGETIALAGFDGADLSVRKGGHVSPQHVAVELPRAFKALQKSGIRVPMMVTDIDLSDVLETERVLGTASELGIRYYRLASLRYDPGKSIQENLDLHKKTIKKIEKINRKFGIHGCYQNHAGTRVGSPLWDLYRLVKDCDPTYFGVQYDIRHAVCEGGTSWPLAMKLLSPWIKTTDIKDFFWENKDGHWKTTNVPLGNGMVDFDKYLGEYVALGISGPVSIHYEYDLGGAESGKRNPAMNLDEILDYLKSDLNWLKRKFKEHGYFNS